MVAYTRLFKLKDALSDHPAALQVISFDIVMTLLSPTYQCSRCHYRRRNGGLSFPCHRLHRGLCRLAGAFELEEHNVISKTQPLITLPLLPLTVHTCVDVIAVRRFPQSFHNRKWVLFCILLLFELGICDFLVTKRIGSELMEMNGSHHPIWLFKKKLATYLGNVWEFGKKTLWMSTWSWTVSSTAGNCSLLYCKYWYLDKGVSLSREGWQDIQFIHSWIHSP